MKKNCLLIFILVTSILINACSLEKSKEREKVEIDEMNSNQDNNQKEESMATKEFLMNLFSVTAEDLEGIPVEEIIYYHKITEDQLIEVKRELVNSVEVSNYLKILQENMEEEKRIEEEYGKVDFNYVLEAEEFKGELPKLNTIKYLVDSNGVGTGGYSCVIDFERNKIYYSLSVSYTYNDVRYADNVIDLTPKRKEEIIKALEVAKIGAWDYKNGSYGGEGGEECLWLFGVEFNDGAIAPNYGLDGTHPKSYLNLEEVLYDN